MDIQKVTWRTYLWFKKGIENKALILSFARFSYKDAGNITGASKQVEDTGAEINIEPDR